MLARDVNTHCKQDHVMMGMVALLETHVFRMVMILYVVPQVQGIAVMEIGVMAKRVVSVVNVRQGQHQIAMMV